MGKKVNRYRDMPLLVMVTAEEKKQIRKNMEAAGLRTMTNYVRKMALTGRVIKIDFTTLKQSLAETGQYVYELNKIGNNLNQIAHKLNQTDIVEQEDVKALVSEFSKIQENYQSSQKILLQEIEKIIGSE
ncbi:plasmid mobilization protein [uncultured Enterococcus sp.]|uniref:plasmid mobilization protein n=1 Tax=uncultured Enterococcus sp. TaxID=167972 RepID=UPI002AA8B882|nr:plasmid mobilization relaxosome protein MobC [uncultured Enterococcus sp.]